MTEKERIDALEQRCVALVRAMVSGLPGGRLVAISGASQNTTIGTIAKMRACGIRIQTYKKGHQNVYYLKMPLDKAIAAIPDIFKRKGQCDACGRSEWHPVLIDGKRLCGPCAKKHAMENGVVCVQCGERLPYKAFPKRNTRTGIVTTCSKCSYSLPPTSNDIEGFGFHTWAILTDDCRRVYTDIDEGKYKNGQAKAEMTSGISFEEEV